MRSGICYKFLCTRKSPTLKRPSGLRYGSERFINIYNNGIIIINIIITRYAYRYYFFDIRLQHYLPINCNIVIPITGISGDHNIHR